MLLESIYEEDFLESSVSGRGEGRMTRLTPYGQG